MANELMIAPLLPSTGYSDNFRTSMNKKTNIILILTKSGKCSHSGQTGHLDVLEKSWLVQHQRKSVRLIDADGRQKRALNRSLSRLVMASKRREDKGGWEKLDKKLTVRLLLPASLTIEHVAYEHYSKIPGHP